jgi:hypothetical protein
MDRPETFNCAGCRNAMGGCKDCTKYYYYNKPKNLWMIRSTKCNEAWGCLKQRCNYGHGKMVYIDGITAYEGYGSEPQKEAEVSAIVVAGNFKNMNSELEDYVFSDHKLKFRAKPVEKYDLSTIDGRVKACAWIVENAIWNPSKMIAAITGKKVKLG